jgi:hypothetical protein
VQHLNGAPLELEKDVVFKAFNRDTHVRQLLERGKSEGFHEFSSEHLNESFDDFLL